MTYHDRFASTTLPAPVEVDFDTYDPPAPPSVVWDAAVNCGSPFGPVLDVLPNKPPKDLIRPRPTVLRNETWKLYNAMSFLTWQTDLCFNASITLAAEALGFANHAEFVSLMPEWHKEMNRSLFDGDEKERKRQEEGQTRQRISKRMGRIVSHPHYWMSVVEYGRDHGLHVHALCVAPKSVQTAFEEKTWAWWGKKSPGEVKPNGIAFRFRNPTGLQRQYALQCRLFRYIAKTTDEGLMRMDHEGKVWTAREIFRPDPNDCTPVLVEVPQMAQISHRLNHGAQLAAGFQSKYDLGCFEEVYSGWEIGARTQRGKEREMNSLLASLQF